MTGFWKVLLGRNLWTEEPNQPTGEPNQKTGEQNQWTGEPNQWTGKQNWSLKLIQFHQSMDQKKRKRMLWYTKIFRSYEMKNHYILFLKISNC